MDCRTACLPPCPEDSSNELPWPAPWPETPAVLLLDEPFSAVDQVTRRKLRLELAALTRTLHIPIVLVTHDLDEAAMLAHRLCVVHAGHSLQTGATEAVMKHPVSAQVARLLDAPNLFQG